MENLKKAVYEAIGETYMKYGEVQVVTAVEHALFYGYAKYFTNGKNEVRAKLCSELKRMGEPIENNNKMDVKKCTHFNNTFFNALIDCYTDVHIANGGETDKSSKIYTLHTPAGKRSDPGGFNLRNAMMQAYKIDYGTLCRSQRLEYPVYDFVVAIGEEYVYEREQENQNKLKAKNVQAHGSNFEQVTEKMAYVSGLSVYKEGRINMHGMHAATSIGKKRHNQEDAVLIQVHPNNPDFKLLVVSDGMGGGECGEVVSDYTINQVSEWFQALPDSDFNRMESVLKKLNVKLNEISGDMFDRFNDKGGATFVGAIVGADKTIVTNVGDSRAYAYSNGDNDIRQISKDHSAVQIEYEMGWIPSREAMRFSKRNNRITQYIGQEDDIKAYNVVLDNSNYDKLILLSDGVSDCLSDKDIFVITKNTPTADLATKLVGSALQHTSYAGKDLTDVPGYNSVIDAGKDNTTAGVIKSPKSKDSFERD